MSDQPRSSGILYVDDGTSERGIVLDVLRSQSQFHVYEACTPADVERLLADKRIGLVVSELSTWGGRELEILDQVASVGAGQRVIILTSRGTEHSAVESLKRGAADYVSKRTSNYPRQLLQSLSSTATSIQPLPRELAQLYSNAAGLLSVIGFDGYLKQWNPAWRDILGYDERDLASVVLRDLIHPDDLERTTASGEKIRAGQAVKGIEARVRCKDGSYKWLLWNAVPCVDQQVYFATSQDITAHKELEEQLLVSEARFQLIASATKEAVWDWDLRNNRVWRNDAYLQAYGAPETGHEDPTEWWLSRIHPEDRPRVAASLPPPIVDGRQRWAFEYRFRRLDDCYSHVFARGFTVFNGEGQAVRMVGSVLDITPLKMAEERLRESEERFRLAAKATRDALWDWDMRKGEVWRSEGFQTLFGYSDDELQGGLDWWIERIHPLDRERVFRQIPSPGPSQARQCEFEYRLRRADGNYADVVDRGFVISGADGTPVRMVGSIMDITHRRQTEELATIQRAELAHFARVSTMGEIATGLAHELNQPLTAIANYAESCTQAILSRAADRDEKLLSWIEKMTTNTHRAAEMIRRLRGFTRKSESRRSTIEINELIHEVVELLEAETRLRNVDLRWQPAGTAHASVDRIQIQQVLVNLLRNAYEAMQQNPLDQRQVTITAAANCDKIEIAVADRGEGIPPENRDRVFDAFFTNKPNGMGIGLSISRSIVEDHGGRLWLSPNSTRGVTFRFTLPMAGVTHDVSTQRVSSR